MMSLNSQNHCRKPQKIRRLRGSIALEIFGAASTGNSLEAKKKRLAFAEISTIRLRQHLSEHEGEVPLELSMQLYLRQ